LVVSDVNGSSFKECCQLQKMITEHEKQKKELPPVQNENQSRNFCNPMSVLILADFSEIKLLRDKNQMIGQFLPDPSVFHPPKGGI
jgi:hypothetical protein